MDKEYARFLHKYGQIGQLNFSRSHKNFWEKYGRHSIKSSSPCHGSIILEELLFSSVTERFLQ